ncbi:MAG: hypothetical protein EZS28_002568 [Streblomastix strix]|uniref:Uncharacterized protein n=1 Tax=Streblomastix strix TaxID=222440 RepID=A0A5J4X3P8_9EUKA|nr:MAG: hypothetical protein EZS28_002568 [Streblomastix strix]
METKSKALKRAQPSREKDVLTEKAKCWKYQQLPPGIFRKGTLTQKQSKGFFEVAGVTGHLEPHVDNFREDPAGTRDFSLGTEYSHEPKHINCSEIKREDRRKAFEFFGQMGKIERRASQTSQGHNFKMVDFIHLSQMHLCAKQSSRDDTHTRKSNQAQCGIQNGGSLRLSEEKRQKNTTRQHRRAPDINKKGDEVYTNHVILLRLSDEEALEVKLDMSENIWRTRITALARLEPFLNEQPDGASCFL